MPPTQHKRLGERVHAFFDRRADLIWIRGERDPAAPFAFVVDCLFGDIRGLNPEMARERKHLPQFGQKRGAIVSPLIAVRWIEECAHVRPIIFFERDEQVRGVQTNLIFGAPELEEVKRENDGNQQPGVEARAKSGLSEEHDGDATAAN